LAFMKNKKSKAILKWLIKCFITIGLLTYLFQKIPLQQITATLLSAQLIYIIPAFFMKMTMHYINAYLLKIFSQKQKMDFSVFELIKINLITQFYGLVLPGELSAGVVKWHKLSKKNVMRAQAFACIVVSRTIRMLSLAVLGIICFLIESPVQSLPVLISLILGLVISIIIYISMTNKDVFFVIETLLRKLNFIKIPQWIKKKLKKVAYSIKRFHEISFWTSNYILLLSFIYHLAGILAFYFILQIVNINISLNSIVWIRAAITFIQLLPITISGLGVREGAFVFLLKKYSIAPSSSMTASLILFSMTVMIAFIGGGFEIQEFLFKKKKGKE